MAIVWDIFKSAWVEVGDLQLIKSSPPDPPDWAEVCDSIIKDIDETGSIERLIHVLRMPEAQLTYELHCVIADLLEKKKKRKRGAKRKVPASEGGKALLKHAMNERIKHEREMLSKRGERDCSERAAIESLARAYKEEARINPASPKYTVRAIEEIIHPRKSRYHRKP